LHNALSYNLLISITLQKHSGWRVYCTSQCLFNAFVYIWGIHL